MDNSENKEIIQVVVNVETGESIDIYSGDRVRIVRGQQEIPIKKAEKTNSLNKDIQDWGKELGGFVFVLFKYSTEFLEHHPEVTSEDITKLFYLATYVDYDGYLVSGKAYMKKNEIQNILKLGKSQFYNFFNKMVKLNIFIQDQNKNTKINKNCFVKGNIDKEIKKYTDYTRVYINTIRYLFENVAPNKHKQLGNYFKMIPFIHRQQNALCWNPNSKAEDIHLMTLQELKDILGYDRNGIRAFKNELFRTKLENGKSIIGLFQTESDEGKSYIIINPQVLYGGNFRLDYKDENKNGRGQLMKYFNKPN